MVTNSSGQQRPRLKSRKGSRRLRKRRTQPVDVQYPAEHMRSEIIDIISNDNSVHIQGDIDHSMHVAHLTQNGANPGVNHSRHHTHPVAPFAQMQMMQQHQSTPLVKGSRVFNNVHKLSEIDDSTIAYMRLAI
mmetsp:Transcript_46659/g.61764  ORF Transcript_46659/g.61764 Transcript_46659/m.61764 type:complete len:133 (-) Transcript_46659:364-762(-)